MALITENGWPQVDSGSLDHSPFPGVNGGNSIPLAKGQPAKVMKAFAADYHRFVESLDNGKQDNGGWTPTNSVWNSNHLSGTAMDLNWSDHPFQVKGTFTQEELQTIRELLDYYEGTIFWGGDWTSPVDEMHWQMGYNTRGNPALDDFIARKIKGDGTSRFEDDVFNAGAVEDENRKPVRPGEGGTFWNDVSQYQQKPIDESYKWRVFAFRTNSGDKKDTLAEENARRALEMLNSGRLDIVIPYYFFWPGQDNCDLHKEILARVGLWVHPRTLSMVDVESANWQITGTHSAEINDEVRRMQGWYGNPRRVIGYYNSNATPDLWPTRGRLNLVVPQYNRKEIGDISSIKDSGVRKDAVAHQYSDALYDQPPWIGIATDGNWSPYEIDELVTLFGLEPSESWIYSAPDRYIPAPVVGIGTDDLNATAALIPELTEKRPSFSRYRVPGEPDWSVIDLIRTMDAMIHESFTERLALLGSVYHIRVVAQKAAEGDPIALAVLYSISMHFLDAADIDAKQVVREYNSNRTD